MRGGPESQFKSGKLLTEALTGGGEVLLKGLCSEVKTMLLVIRFLAWCQK